MSAWLFDHPVVALAMLWLPISALTVIAFHAIKRAHVERPAGFVQCRHVRPLPPAHFDFEAQR